MESKAPQKENKKERKIRKGLELLHSYGNFFDHIPTKKLCTQNTICPFRNTKKGYCGALKRANHDFKHGDILSGQTHAVIVQFCLFLDKRVDEEMLAGHNDPLQNIYSFRDNSGFLITVQAPQQNPSLVKTR